MKQPDQSQLDAIIDRQGHEPCPGVEILFDQEIRTSPDGFRQHATIFRPAVLPGGRAPAVLAFHGGGFQNGDPNGCGALGKFLALALGITTVSASYRLADEKNPSFPAVLDDAVQALRWLHGRAAPLNIDPAHVILAGESAGVFLAAHLAVASPWVAAAQDLPRPAALIAQWGPIDLVARWFDRGESPGAEQLLLGAHYASDPALYHRASPITYARGALPPALFIYGRQDAVVQPRQAHLGFAAWTRAGCVAEAVIYNNIGHGVTGDNREQRLAVVGKAAAFIHHALWASVRSQGKDQ